MSNIIIIGDGIAAINAVKAIRTVDPDVEIDIFGEERFYPYYRLKLSKSLFDPLDESALLLQPKDWYEKNKVNLHVNVKVLGVDPYRQEILLPQATRMNYEKLLFANGAMNCPLLIKGLNHQKLNTIRNLADVQKVREKLEGKNQVLYVGGGVLGLEMAWVLQQHHKEVTITEIQNHLFPKQLDERAARILQNIVESFGVHVLTHTEIVDIVETDGLTGVELNNEGFYPCDIVLYSTGIQPNIDMVQDTGIQTNRGIIIDHQMQTNIANIYAAGDVAEFAGKVCGLWSIAAEQGKIAGYNMIGREMYYQPPVPLTFLNAYHTSLFSMGDISKAADTYTIIEEDPGKNVYRRIFFRNQIIVGAIMIGETGQSLLLKNAIEQKTSLEGIACRGITTDEILEHLKNRKNNS